MSKFEAEDIQNLDNIVTRHRMIMDMTVQTLNDAAFSGKETVENLEIMAEGLIGMLNNTTEEGIKLAIEVLAVDTNDLRQAVDSINKAHDAAWNRISGAQMVLSGLALPATLL